MGSLPTFQRLHDLSVWISSSDIRQAQWDRDIGLRLGIDNTTRWSSWYLFIGKALRKKTDIVRFLIDHENDLSAIRLTGPDWDLLGKAYTFLQPFYQATLWAEGNKSSIGQTLVILDSLLTHYESEKV